MGGGEGEGMGAGRKRCRDWARSMGMGVRSVFTSAGSRVFPLVFKSLSRPLPSHRNSFSALNSDLPVPVSASFPLALGQSPRVQECR